MNGELRDTPYALELMRVSGNKEVYEDGAISEARIERIHRHEDDKVLIRFSWWVDNKFQPRPLDITEETLLPMLVEAIQRGMFTTDFVNKLHLAEAEWNVAKEAP